VGASGWGGPVRRPLQDGSTVKRLSDAGQLRMIATLGPFEEREAACAPESGGVRICLDSGRQSPLESKLQIYRHQRELRLIVKQKIGRFF